MSAHDAVRTGVCIVRAQTDVAAGVLITVTTRPDVQDAAGESVMCTAAATDALARVADFLHSFARDGT